MFALRRFIMVMGLLLYVAPALPAQAQEQDWNQLIEGARREGKVVVSGPPNPDVRRDLPARFKKRFGIPLEYIGGRSSVLAGKLRGFSKVSIFKPRPHPNAGRLFVNWLASRGLFRV